MAGREDDENTKNMNIQRIVAAVVTNLHTLPTPGPLSVNSVNRETSSRRFKSSELE